MACAERWWEAWPGGSEGAAKGAKAGVAVGVTRNVAERSADRRAMDSALFAFTYADRPEMVDDFLSPPKATGLQGARGSVIATSRCRAEIQLGPRRPGRQVRHPPRQRPDGHVRQGGSDPDERDRAGEDAGRAGDPGGPLPGPQGGWPRGRPLRMGVVADGPQRDPDGRDRGRAAKSALVRVDYSTFPVLDPRTNGRFGQVEVMGIPDGRAITASSAGTRRARARFASRARSSPARRSSPSAATRTSR